MGDATASDSVKTTGPRNSQDLVEGEGLEPSTPALGAGWQKSSVSQFNLLPRAPIAIGTMAHN